MSDGLPVGRIIAGLVALGVLVSVRTMDVDSLLGDLKSREYTAAELGLKTPPPAAFVTTPPPSPEPASGLEASPEPTDPLGEPPRASPGTAATPKPGVTVGGSDHQMTVAIRLSDNGTGTAADRSLGLQVEDRLIGALHRNRTGLVDGHEIGAGYFMILVTGRDADRMYQEARRALIGMRVPVGSYVTLRYSDDAEQRITLR